MDDADATWDAMVAACRAYAGHMDQWDEFSFNTSHGRVYVKIGRDVPDPENYPNLDEVPHA